MRRIPNPALVSLASGLAAQSPCQLVKDLNQNFNSAESSNPGSFVKYGNGCARSSPR